jgi:hypothetical protein
VNSRAHANAKPMADRSPCAHAGCGPCGLRAHARVFLS